MIQCRLLWRAAASTYKWPVLLLLFSFTLPTCLHPAATTSNPFIRLPASFAMPVLNRDTSTGWTASPEGSDATIASKQMDSLRSKWTGDGDAAVKVQRITQRLNSLSGDPDELSVRFQNAKADFTELTKEWKEESKVCEDACRRSKQIVAFRDLQEDITESFTDFDSRCESWDARFAPRAVEVKVTLEVGLLPGLVEHLSNNIDKNDMTSLREGVHEIEYRVGKWNWAYGRGKFSEDTGRGTQHLIRRGQTYIV